VTKEDSLNLPSLNRDQAVYMTNKRMRMRINRLTRVRIAEKSKLLLDDSIIQNKFQISLVENMMPTTYSALLKINENRLNCLIAVNSFFIILHLALYNLNRYLLTGSCLPL
jgi:hypothetical protein